jgi:hypothetical protein
VEPDGWVAVLLGVRCIEEDRRRPIVIFGIGLRRREARQFPPPGVRLIVVGVPVDSLF